MKFAKFLACFLALSKNLCLYLFIDLRTFLPLMLIVYKIFLNYHKLDQDSLKFMLKVLRVSQSTAVDGFPLSDWIKF